MNAPTKRHPIRSAKALPSEVVTCRENSCKKKKIAGEENDQRVKEETGRSRSERARQIRDEK